MGLTRFLIGRIIKKTGGKDIHAAVGKFGGAVGIACNLALASMKLAAGLLAGSVSVIADAVNNLSDAAASVVTLLGFRLAERPADSDHPYGHARYEYIAGTVIAALILMMGGELARSSVGKILSPSGVNITFITIAALSISLLVKLWLSSFYSALGGMISSETLFAAAADSKNDVLATCAVLVGCCIELLFHINPDGWIGLAVAAFVIFSGISTAKDAVSPLLGKSADPEFIEKLSALVLAHEEVLGIHDLLIHDYGPGHVYASVHVELDADRDVVLCHELIDEIEDEAFEKENVRLVIHYDPVVRDDPEQNEADRAVRAIVSELDGRFSVHDLRLIRRATKNRLIFDLSVPYSALGKRGDIRESIDAALAARGMDYTTVIRFDGE